MKRMSGYTLIELLIAVSVLTILAAVAYPSYLDYTARARRADAKAALLKLQLAEEKYRTSHTTYGSLSDLGFSSSSPERYYAIALDEESVDAFGYTATATPTGAQAGDPCGVFAVNEEGKTSSDDQSTDAKVEECWGK